MLCIIPNESSQAKPGQGMVGRLYEELKDWYRIFLDSEAKFKIHDLQLIVQHTEVFVFVLTSGILLSHWCCEELKSALHNKKKVRMEKFSFQFLIHSISSGESMIPRKIWSEKLETE